MHKFEGYEDANGAQHNIDNELKSSTTLIINVSMLKLFTESSYDK